MTTAPYASAIRVFWAVENGSSDNGARSVEWITAARPTAALVHLPVHASWLGRDLLLHPAAQGHHLRRFQRPRTARRTRARFQDRYNTAAEPFDRKYTRTDLNDYLHRLGTETRRLTPDELTKMPTSKRWTRPPRPTARRSRAPLSDRKNGPACGVGSTGPEMDNVLTGVESVGRAAHRFDGESQPVAFGIRMIGSMDLDPSTRVIPPHSDARPMGISEPNSCNSLGVPKDVGECMVDSDIAELTCPSEVKRPAVDPFAPKGQQTIRGDLQECLGRQLEAPGIKG